uniref:Uncharacterized protein n=1 Tax=Hordeum vulgare subsp. vulgare TaxID=112509 RepID=A0A8I6Z0W8_HORVV
MAGRELSALAFAFARFLQKENTRFPRTQRHRIARRRQGLGARNGPRRRSFTRNHRQNRSGPHRRFFAGNHRQNRRRGYARRGNQPLRGRAPTMHQAGSSTPATAPLQQARPSAPATSPSAFNIPPMDWLLTGPSASFLGEDVMFPCELTPPPLPPYCMQHEFGPCPARTDGHVPDLPSPTPAAAAHTSPVPDLPSPTPDREERGGYPTIPVLNVQIKVEEEGMEDMGSSSSLPLHHRRHLLLLRLRPFRRRHRRKTAGSCASSSLLWRRTGRHFVARGRRTPWASSAHRRQATAGVAGLRCGASPVFLEAAMGRGGWSV